MADQQGWIYADDQSVHAVGMGGQLLMAAATPTDTAVDANDIGAVAMSLDRRMLVDADITASVALDVSAANVTVVGTGTFVAQVDGAALTSLQLIDDVVYTDDTSTHATGTSKGALLMAAATPTDGSVDANDIGAVAMSTDRRLLVDADIVASVALDVSAATVTVDSELPAAAVLADDAANPTAPAIGAFAMGYDSGNTNWNRVEVDDAGHLQVDVLTGGGVDTPTNPATKYVTSASLAAAGSVDLDSGDLSDKKLTQVTAWSSVPYRVRLYTVDDGVESTDPYAIGGGAAYQGWIWDAPHRDYVQAPTGGVDQFRLEFTNLDDNLAADVYCVFMYED
jgi:hypothetical protein